MDIKNEMVKRLRQDCETLLNVKIPRALENISDERGVNTYRNLTKALADNIKLIEEYDYQLMYSEYTDVTDENKPVKQVAVWEQNGDCDIRNHKVWNVKDINFNDSKYGLVADIVGKCKIDTSGISNFSELIKNEIPKIIEDVLLNKDVTETIKTPKGATLESGHDKYNDFEENLKLVIKSFSVDGKIIIPTSEAIRGVGKTTFLIKQAIENDGIYMGKSKSHVAIASKIADEKFGSILQTGFFKADAQGRKKFSCDKILYIDEGVDLGNIDLENNKYVAFKYIHLNNR